MPAVKPTRKGRAAAQSHEQESNVGDGLVSGNALLHMELEGCVDIAQSQVTVAIKVT